MSTDTIPSPSVATLRRQLDSDSNGVCRVCGAEPDWKCDEVAHRLVSGDASVDVVNRPAHYTRGRIEVRDFIADQGLNFNRGSAVKYITRAGHKDPSREVEDLEKAVCCIQHEIALLKKRDRNSAAPVPASPVPPSAGAGAAPINRLGRACTDCGASDGDAHAEGCGWITTVPPTGGR